MSSLRICSIIAAALSLLGIVACDPVHAGNEILLQRGGSHPSSCAQAIRWAGNRAKSGIYQLELRGSNLPPFYVYCLQDPKGGAAWTVVQRRQNKNIDFYRGWQDYKAGFGNLESNYFIGLDKLHAMTNLELNELWVQLEDFENGTRLAKYSSFAIGNANEKYALNLIGGYSGDAGDSLLNYHQGQKFTTFDQDNDAHPNANCAKIYKGAWWHNNCHESNLNGLYKGGATEVFAEGVAWKAWRGYYYSLKYAHMAIRPRA